MLEKRETNYTIKKAVMIRITPDSYIKEDKN
jgi:hypothetical protein